MRVRFLKAYAGPECAARAAGEVVELGYDVAARLYAEGVLVASPRTEAEIQAAASRPEPGDEGRKPEDIARRQAELAAVIRQNEAGAETLLPPAEEPAKRRKVTG